MCVTEFRYKPNIRMQSENISKFSKSNMLNNFQIEHEKPINWKTEVENVRYCTEMKSESILFKRKDNNIFKLILHSKYWLIM